MKKITLQVEGMSCQHCVKAVTDALQGIGLDKVEVSLENKTVAAEYDETKISLEKIKQEIEDQGYDVVE